VAKPDSGSIQLPIAANLQPVRAFYITPMLDSTCAPMAHHAWSSEPCNFSQWNCPLTVSGIKLLAKWFLVCEVFPHTVASCNIKKVTMNYERKMIQSRRTDDLPTVAAVGLLAMCLVTICHEAVGHAGTCLLLGGHISLLTSSLFRCTASSGWVDAGGPILNLVCGLLALIAFRFIPLHLSRTRLFLLLVTALSWFWEGGYAIHAMHHEDGDLYSFVLYLLRHISVAERCMFAALGLALYVFTVRLTSHELLCLASSARQARAMARAAWIAAALGAAIAGAFGPGAAGLRDAVLEIGLASFPLLLIPRGHHEVVSASSTASITRSPLLIASSIIAFGLFVVTLGLVTKSVLTASLFRPSAGTQEVIRNYTS